MPRRSSVDLLPDDVRKWLDKALVGRAFSGYASLVDELAERGYAISKSALQRHGSAFENYLERVKSASHKAAAIAEALPDDAGQLGEAVTQMLQTKVMDLVVEMEIEADDVKFTDLVAAVAKLNASSVQQKKWAAEARTKAKAAADAIGKVAKAGGLSPEAVKTIKAEIMGIVK